MRYLDLTLPLPAENLALDEALLDQAEQSAEPQEILRVWEPGQVMVVVGRSSRLEEEVDLAACRAAAVPVLRRASGGAAIVTGPGCLMYGLILSCQRQPALRAVDLAHQFVLQRMVAALERRVPHVRCQGISDLALEQRKFSGNSMRCKREHLLYHGTLLYDFPLDLVGRFLRQPPRQPEYRAGRDHGAFLTNLPLDATTLRQALAAAWQADRPYADWPQAETARLALQRYSQADWNQRL